MGKLIVCRLSEVNFRRIKIVKAVTDLTADQVISMLFDMSPLPADLAESASCAEVKLWLRKFEERGGKPFG